MNNSNGDVHAANGERSNSHQFESDGAGEPIASHVKGYPFEVSLPRGSSVDGMALADQSLDWRERWADFAAKAAPSAMRSVRKLIAGFLEIG